MVPDPEAESARYEEAIRQAGFTGSAVSREISVGSIRRRSSANSSRCVEAVNRYKPPSGSPPVRWLFSRELPGERDTCPSRTSCDLLCAKTG